MRRPADELQVRRCRRCGHVAWPARLLCPRCACPEDEPVPAGHGVVRERTDTRDPAGAPVALVTVELSAGPSVIARTDDARAEDSVTLLATGDGAVHARRA